LAREGNPGALPDPQRTQWVISQATSSMLDAAHTLTLVMAVVPIVAIVLAFRWLRSQPNEGRRPCA